MPLNYFGLTRSYSLIRLPRAHKLGSPGLESFPNTIECVVQPFCRHRSDGKSGREITSIFKGRKFSAKGTIDLECSGVKETIDLYENDENDHYSKNFKALTGQKIETLVQEDVPRMSRGIIPVEALCGIRYCFTANHSSLTIYRFKNE
jgi:hypothetical protein